ncbi:UPF0575 protein C19orf67 homolog [Mobula hypostoma]|uniref:UPF0575 protein C19orf67 homolog n=1 Tax=Mobula hypostoma TaxID=723540 RepID=UPI002FC38B30
MEENVSSRHEVLSYKRKDKSICSFSVEVTNIEPNWADPNTYQVVGQGKPMKENEAFLPILVNANFSTMQASQDLAMPVQNNDTLQLLHQGKDNQQCGTNERMPQYDVTLMEEKLQPIEQQLQYLLKKAEEFQTHLVYSRDRIHNEEFARAVPVFVKTCQPYFAYLESTARSIHSDRKPLPEYIQKRLLQFSQQLASSLEQLVLMYASFGFISLEETDPCSISYFYRGEFHLGLCFRISIYRYCMPVPYTVTKEPSQLFKKIRWNVDINGGTAFGDTTEPGTEYYFLCYKETSQVMDNHQGSKGATTGKSRRLWSIGRWVQVEPPPGEQDLLRWFLYKQPRGDYELLVTIGFEEPTQIAATDLLVDILMSQKAPTLFGNCLPDAKPIPYLQVQSHQESSTPCQVVSSGLNAEGFPS